MKFKLDENLPRELVTDLRDLGHDADPVIDEGLCGAADPAVLDAASGADRAVWRENRSTGAAMPMPRWGLLVL